MPTSESNKSRAGRLRKQTGVCTCAAISCKRYHAQCFAVLVHLIVVALSMLSWSQCQTLHVLMLAQRCPQELAVEEGKPSSGNHDAAAVKQAPAAGKCNVRPLGGVRLHMSCCDLLCSWSRLDQQHASVAYRECALSRCSIVFSLLQQCDRVNAPSAVCRSQLRQAAPRLACSAARRRPSDARRCLICHA